MPTPMTRVQIINNPNQITTLSDGAGVLSVKADGSFDIVPMGSFGATQQCTINGNIAAYYFPGNNTVYTYAFVETIPNLPGWSAICLSAL